MIPDIKLENQVRLFIVCENLVVAHQFAERNGFPRRECRFITNMDDAEGISGGFYIFINGNLPIGVWEHVIYLENIFNIYKIVVEYDYVFSNNPNKKPIRIFINWVRDLFEYLKQIGRYNRYSQMFKSVK